MNSSNNPFTVLEGQGGLTKTVLVAPDGAQAEVYLHGGHLTSWIPAGGNEQIYLSPKGEFTSQAAIRGGVPVIFPQFSSLGSLQKHGFARTMTWQVHGVETNNDLLTAAFTLSDSPETLKVWPHPFQLDLVITLGGNRISLTLSITNTGQAAFRFTTAFHTYLSVSNISNVRITGLKDLVYTDHAAGGIEEKQKDDVLLVEGEVDRVYHNARPVLTLYDGNHPIKIGKRGFSDYVIWNPGSRLSQALPDLGPEAYKSFICIESALINKPVRLSPEESWQGYQSITIPTEKAHG